MDNWISVNTELPELGTYVLVSVPKYRQKMMVAKMDTVFEKEFVANAICITEHVTHWMPLPSEPPKP